MASGAVSSTRAFSLIELLTVIAIITLLISILIPSLTAARNSAKKTSTAATLNAVKVGLESFKNDNENEFKATNGYPPSYVYPPIPGATFQAHLGQFPFSEGNVKVYGAHWLPAMLMGPDLQGFIPRSNVPPALASKPSKWYKPDPLGKLLPRSNLYLEPGSVKLIATQDLPGRRPEDQELWPNWGSPTSPTDEFTMRQLPVIVDAFDQPVLYYASNKFAGGRNLVEEKRRPANDYGDRGQPYYFHEDNAGFTGVGMWEKSDGFFRTNDPGWNFAGGAAAHPIGEAGHMVTASDVETKSKGKTFARYILDRNAYRALSAQQLQNPKTPLRPVNADTFLLISPGVDGLYGTKDDVSNLPQFAN